MIAMLKSSLSRLLVLFCLLSLMHLSAFAETNPEIANCRDLKDEATVTQADFCKAHIGCRMVLAIQVTCAKAKNYLNRLTEAINRPAPVLSEETKQEGVLNRLVYGARDFLGTKKDGRNPIEPNHVLEAAISPTASERAAKDPAWQQNAEQIKGRLLQAERNEVTGQDSGGKWVYIGDTRFGKAQGWGTKFYTDGSIQGGQFEQDQIKGQADLIASDGGRRTGRIENGQLQGKGFEYYAAGSSYSGEFEAGRRQGSGTLIQSDGSRLEGSWSADRVNGSATKYRADGSVEERGMYRDGNMVFGQRFDDKGQVLAQTQTSGDLYEQARYNAEQTREKERQIAQAKRDQEERRAAEERRMAEAKAEEENRKQAEYQARVSRMNPGELFVLADQLGSEGKTSQAQNVFRQLLSKYPDHALAAQAAQRLGGGSSSTSESNSQNRQTTLAGSSSGGRGYESICDRDDAKIQDVIKKSGLRFYFSGYGKYLMDKLTVEREARCKVASSTILKAYKDAINDIRKYEQECGGRQIQNSLECHLKDEDNKFIALLSQETRRALSDSNYSASYGSVRGTTNSSQQVATSACTSKEQQVKNTKIPPNASITASTETVMFMTMTAMEMFAANCPGVTREEQQQYKQSYEAAEQACNAVQSGSRRCAAKNHFGP